MTDTVACTFKALDTVLKETEGRVTGFSFECLGDKKVSDEDAKIVLDHVKNSPFIKEQGKPLLGKIATTEGDTLYVDMYIVTRDNYKYIGTEVSSLTGKKEVVYE